MILSGRVKDINTDWITGKANITLEINEKLMDEINTIAACDKLRIELKKYRNHRSNDANAMLWACLSEIAAELKTDKWSVYLEMLKRYGKHTYICVKPSMVDAVKAQWRECVEIGEVNINGQKSVQMLCYFGSSTFDSKEFSVFLDGVVSEMKEMGLQPPPSDEMERAIKLYEETMVSIHK